MTFIDLFSGIGGFSKGFTDAGMTCVAQVEIDPWCRRVLAKHWPDVPKFEDVREFALKPDPALACDVICGGFPCQDISSSNQHGKGLHGERSGLWFEYSRIVRVLRPRFVVLENVDALRMRGLGTVLGDLAACGYSTEWQTVSASAFGLPHGRRRLFVVADAGGVGSTPRQYLSQGALEEFCPEPISRRWQRSGEWQPVHANADRVRLLPKHFDGRGDDGIPHRLDRIRGVGNAVVPVVAEWIARRLIMIGGRS